MPRCPTGVACASGASDAYHLTEPDARRRHDPLRGQPHPLGAGRESDPGDRDPAAAPRHGPLARAPGRTRGALGGRPREAPLRALRRRPHAPLAPAHGRQVGGVPARTALAPEPATGVARDPHARARGGAVRRAGARADDRVANALRPAARGARARHPGRGARLRRVPAPAAPGRSHARHRRRSAGPAQHRGHREPLEGRGVLPRRRQSLARGGRRARHAGARDGGGHPAADAGVGRPRLSGARSLGLRAARAPVPPLRHDHPRPRAGRRQRTTYWCPACQA